MIIDPEKITPIGKVLKTHGIQGELNVALDIDTGYAEEPDSFAIMEVEGIPTPFAIRSVRPKGSTTLLITLSGIEDVESAKLFVGKIVYTDRERLQRWLQENDEEPQGEGMYADALRGYRIIDRETGEVGVIESLNLSTNNPLFEVRTPDGRMVYIPIADEFVTEIDEEHNEVHTDLPEGLLSMQ